MRNSHTLVLLALLLVGCGATPEKIATWKGTQRGPQKLHDVVADDSAAPELRGLAAAALVEIGLSPDAATTVNQASEATRAQVVHEAIAPLATLLGSSATLPGPTTAVQRAAKDVLFEIRPASQAADRQRIDQLLIQWTTADLAVRSGQGGESSEKILSAIGVPAAPALVQLLRPGQDLLVAATLIGDIGDKSAQLQAAQKLETVAKGGAVGTQIIGDATLQALGLIGGAEATRFLLEVANKSSKDTREKALGALAQGKVTAGDPVVLAGGLAIAGDTHAPGGAREAAFTLLEKVGPSAVPGLTKIFGDANTQARYRAIEAALLAGGASAIAPTLAALPQDRPIPNDDFDGLIVDYIVKVGKDAVPPLRAAVIQKTKKPPALSQIAALRALAKLGTSKDIDVVAPLLSDATPCPTLKSKVPVKISDEAQKAKAALSRR